MRKGLTILGILFIILIVSGGMLSPRLVAGALTAKIVNSLSTSDVQVDVSSTPPVAVLWGKMDSIHAIAHQAKVGEVYLSQISLEGKDVRMDMKSFLEGNGIRVDSAESLEIKGFVTEENLRELIARKAERLEDVAVQVKPDGIHVTANTKLMGRKVEISMEGLVLEDAGALYFRVTKLNLKNSLLGKARLDNFMDDILLMKSDKLPLEAQFEDVAMKDGKVVITAGRKNGTVKK